MEPFLSATRPATYDFFFGDLDTLIRVEELGGEVLVRCSRESFSPRRKEFFIRELAAEGFIPDEFRWMPLAEGIGSRGVKWVTDISWLEIPKALLERSRRFMIRLLVGSTALWLVGIAACVIHPWR